jgi:hypothetical protein
MDREALVITGQELVKLLDKTTVKPRAALWVSKPDNDTWRLWLVPQKGVDHHEFYRLVSHAISNNRSALHGIDISDVELIQDSHPAIQGLKTMMRMSGLGSAFLSNNKVNGYYLPDGVLLRMDL